MQFADLELDVLQSYLETKGKNINSYRYALLGIQSAYCKSLDEKITIGSYGQLKTSSYGAPI